jgi:prepilin peptidase CpaA
MSPLHPLLALLLGGLTVSAAVYDIRYRRIPNFLSVSGFAAGLAANVYLSHWEGLRQSLIGFAVAAVVYVLLYVLRAIGAGDVKLMSAIGAIVGVVAWFKIFLITAIAGAVGALVLVVLRGRSRQTLMNIGLIVSSLARLERPHQVSADLDVRSPHALRMPHAVPIACGSLVYLWLQAIGIF